tara:strand:+ start:183 stop:428 length:246 start_codon:yes stop_codon:yes gene_type:complete
MSTIKIYGISDCPACLKAQAIAMNRYPDCEYIYINMDFAESFRNHLRDKFGYKSYPIVTIDDGSVEKLIGGSEQLQAFITK